MPLYIGQSRLLEALCISLCLYGLYWFAESFFLAKRSLAQASTCDEANNLLQQELGLSESEIRLHVIPNENNITTGCWMDRRVDSLTILLVDALRFDFAYYQLPLSIGHRLSKRESNSSQLFQFLADPPTVTMQRIKALTTGSLPTFADITGSFGGASLEEDTWMRQMVNSRNRIGFVGDDTWADLFSADTYFAQSFPYPSFNTRDLDTVDNGCLRHIPDLLQQLPTTHQRDPQQQQQQHEHLDMLIVHFLGVDHVGHTYGPNNEHMDTKLRQMDAALQAVLETVDKAADGTCHSVLIFGDHGMTEDGNHGGGTTEETNAALFVHRSPGCPATEVDSHSLEEQAASVWVKDTLFASIHQIDLVPTISVLLGLPIPFSNLGGLVSSIIPGLTARDMVLALALNAAQVWRYYRIYSSTANRLPGLDQIRERLDLAVDSYKEALIHNDDDDAFHESAALFKVFLNEALELGQRVWTRFDYVGMASGFGLLILATLFFVQPLFTGASPKIAVSHQWERTISLAFLIYLCGVKSFSNSYILEEENATMYCLGILSLVISFRIKSNAVTTTLWRGILLIPVASRLSDLFVSGHGQDPSIRLHFAHNPIVFLGGIFALGSFRWYLYRERVMPSRVHVMADCTSLLLLALGWLEKRNPDPERNGHLLCQATLALLFTGIPVSIFQSALKEDSRFVVQHVLTVVSKVLIAIMVVTGPSTALSLVLYTFQISILLLAAKQMRPVVVTTMLRLITRHAFFATNHGCAFNRLQYSAAFVATDEFVFELGGISLFLNTFGWEIAGLALAWSMSRITADARTWKLYGCWQLVEALTSCISVTVLRRHLMVWDIYAPHFVFTAIFTILNMLSHLTTLSFDQ